MDNKMNNEVVKIVVEELQRVTDELEEEDTSALESFGCTVSNTSDRPIEIEVEYVDREMGVRRIEIY